jgi:hypothetical protein
MCGRHRVVGQVSPPHADVCDADSDGSQIRWAVQPKLHARTETSLDSIENGSCGKGSVVTGLGNDEYATRLTFCYHPSEAIFGGGGGGGGWACGGSRSSFRMKRRSREGRLGPSRAPVRPRLRHRDLQLDACRRCAVESPRSPPAAVQVERVAPRSRRAAGQCERCTGMPHPAWRGPFQPLHLSEPGGAEHHQLPRKS